jgi:hypothetical protein
LLISEETMLPKNRALSRYLFLALVAVACSAFGADS